MEEKEKVEVEIQDEQVETNKKEKKHKAYDIESDERFIEKVNEVLSLKDQLLRKQAEFENYRKRTQEEKLNDRKYALQDFLTEVIDILDIFNTAVNVNTDNQLLKNYLVGFKMINDKLVSILNDYGVKKIDCLNQKFDASLMAAQESVEKDDVEPNTVLEVKLNGYTYKDRVLRYAQVIVSKEKENKEN